MSRSSSRLFASYPASLLARLSPVGLAAIMAVPSAHAQVVSPNLIRNNGEINDRFGGALDRSGDTVVVGAWGVGDSQGGAFVSTRSSSGWSTPVALGGPIEVGDDFGWSVAIDGDAIAVGARSASEPEDIEEPLIETGAVTFYVKQSGQWVPQQRVYSAGRDENFAFGFAVDLLGGHALIGEPGAADQAKGFEETGAAYIYTRNADKTWAGSQRLVAPDAQAGDVFGLSLSLSQSGGRTFAFVSAVGRDDRGQASGAVYIFEKSSPSGSFQFRQKLLAADGAQEDQFGFSVDAQGDRVVIGAPRADLPGATDAGAVYLFERVGSNWVQRDKITAGAGRRSEFFGSTVALNGDGLAVGRNPDPSVAGAREAVSVFERRNDGTFGLKGVLQAPQDTGVDSFASALNYQGATVLVGMERGAGTGGVATGSVVVFDTNAIPAPLGGPLSLAGLALGFVALRRRQR